MPTTTSPPPSKKPDEKSPGDKAPAPGPADQAAEKKSYPSPEAEQAEKVIATIPPEYLTDGLADTIRRSAAVAAQHREHAERHAATEAALDKAVADADHDAAATHAARLLASHEVHKRLPAIGLDRGPVDEALDRAATDMTRRAKFTVPMPLYMRERLVYEQLPINVRLAEPGRRPEVEMPQSVREDIDAVRAYEAYRKEWDRWDQGWQYWQRDRHTADPLMHLGAAAGYRDQLGPLEEKGEKLTQKILEANTAHYAAGITWKKPPGVIVPGIEDL